EDLGGIDTVVFAVDGQDLGTLDAPPWTYRWTAPAVGSTTAVSLAVRATDGRGNTASTTRTVEVAPDIARPYVVIAQPLAGAQFVEGAPISVVADVRDASLVAELRLAIDENEVVLTTPPWSHSFTAPAVTGGASSRYVAVRAMAKSEAGEESAPSVRTITITDDGQPGPDLVLASLPVGPLFLGGTTVEVDAVSLAQGSMTATVGGELLAQAPLGHHRFELPLVPEDAAVAVEATGLSKGGETASASISGALKVFAASAPQIAARAAGPLTTPVAAFLRGDGLLVLGSDGAGHGTLDSHVRADLAATVSRSITGAPVGLGFLPEGPALAIRADGAGVLELRHGSDLAVLDSVALRREPTAIASFSGGLAVGSDEGIEIYGPGLILLAREPMGQVSSLSASGTRLVAIVSGELLELDLSAPYAPQKVRSVPLAGSHDQVLATASGGACVAGLQVACFAPAGATFQAAGQEDLPAAALSLSGLGSWVVVGTASGAVVLDGRAEARSAAFYPELAGWAASAGDDLVAVTQAGLVRLKLGRGQGTPTLSISPPATAAAGARVSLSATVDLGSDPLVAFTSELVVDGTLVEVLDGRLPANVDLPSEGSSATIELRLRDTAGHIALASATVQLVDAGEGPRLVSLQAPAEVLEGTSLHAAAIAEDPARVASVEYSLEGLGPVSASAPALAFEALAPAVAFDSSLSLTAVAIDSQGRRGAPITVQVLVTDDATPAGPLVAIERVQSGPVYEGSLVAVRAVLTPASGIRHVSFAVEGAEQAIASSLPFEARVRMPLGTGSHSVVVTAIAVDDLGLRSAPGALSLVVVDDLAAPVISLAVQPDGTTLSAGASVHVLATAIDSAAVEQLDLTATLDGALVAAGGRELRYALPPDTLMGASLVIRAIAVDRAGNVGIAQTTRMVVQPTAPGDSVALGGSFADADALTVLGDRLLAATPRGLAIARLTRGASPTLVGLGFHATARMPQSVAAFQDLAILALGEDGIEVVDVSQPDHPVRVGHLPGTFTRVVSYNGRLAASDGSVIYSLDVSQPSQPFATALVSGGGLVAVRSLIASGSQLLVGAAKLSGNPTWKSSNIAPAVVRAAEKVGDVIVVGTDRSLRILASDDWQYEALASLADVTVPGVRALAAHGGYAYLACDDANLRIVDIREPRAPALVAVLPLDARALVVSGGTLVATTPSGLIASALPDSNGAAGVEPLATLALVDAPAALSVHRRGFLVAGGAAGVHAYDLEQPASPEARGAIAGTNVRQVEVVDRELLYVDGTSLKVGHEGATGIPGSMSSTWAPVLASWPAVQRLAVSPRRLWTIAGAAATTASLPAAADRASVSLPGGAVDVATDGEHALVALGGNGSALLGLDAASSPEVIGVASEAARAVAIDGELAVVGNAAGLVVYAVTESGLVQKASVATQGEVARVRLVGTLALASEGAAGVELWDLRVPTAPVLVSHLAARRADDAILAAGYVVVADGLAGVLVYAAPDALPAPTAAWLTAAPEELEAGSWVEVASWTRARGVDDAELMVDGASVARLDAADSRAQWQLPASASPGTSVELVMRVRAQGGREAFTSPRRVQVLAPVTELPTVELQQPSANAVFGSGATVTVRARRTHGAWPLTANAWFGTTWLGSLSVAPAAASSVPPTSDATGNLRMPVLDAQTTDQLTVVVVDAAGRSASSSRSVTVKPDTNPPTTPTGLPNELRAGPYVNWIAVSAYDEGASTLRLKVGTSVVATAEANELGVALTHRLLLPEGSIGSTVVLTAEVEDAAGRTSSATRSYVVVPDGVAPTVAFGAGMPPTTAVEGSTVQITVYASDSDGDLESVALYADGVLIRSQANGFVMAYQLPMSSSDTEIVFRAVGTDRRGRVSEATTTTVITGNQPPVASVPSGNWPPASALEGSTVTLYSTASDPDGNLASAAVYANGALIASSSGWLSYQLPSAASGISSVEFRVVAIDSFGVQAEASRTTLVTANRAPVVSFPSAAYPPASAVEGSSVYVSASASDADGNLTKIELFADGALIASGTASIWKSYQLPSGIGAPTTVVFRAVATDAMGVQADATTVTMVTVNRMPTIAFPNATQPPASAVEGSTVPLYAVGADLDGNLAQVEMYADGSLITTGVSSVSVSYQLPSGIGAPRTVTFRAVATDTLGGQSEATAVTTVTVNRPPSISFPYPSNPPASALEGSWIWVTAIVEDPDGNLAKTELFANGTLVTTTSGNINSYSYKLPLLSSGSTQVLFRAVVTDKLGLEASTETTTTIVPNHPPEVVFLKGLPPAWSTEGQFISLLVGAQDPDTFVDSLILSANGTALQPYDYLTPAEESACQGFELCAAYWYQAPSCSSSVQSVVFRAQVTDNLGAQAEATATTQLRTTPPTLVFEPSRGLLAGETADLCVRATGALQADSLTMTIGGLPVAPLLMTCGAGCVQQCSGPYLVPNAGSLVVAATVNDACASAVSANRAYAIQAIPPTLAFLPDRNLQDGEIAHLCAQATDDVEVTSLSMTIDEAPVSGVPSSCGARCLELCADVSVPSGNVTIFVNAMAIDGAGLVTEATHTYSTYPNYAPWVELLQAPVYMAVGESANLTGSVHDELDHVAWAEFRVNGQILDNRFVHAGTGVQLSASFTPTEPGDYLIELVAEDLAGLTGSASQYLLVLVEPLLVTSTIGPDDTQFDSMDILVQAGTLSIDGPHVFRNVVIGAGGVLSHSPNDSSSFNYLDIQATGVFAITPEGTIDVSGRGYLGGHSGDNAAPGGRTDGDQLMAGPCGGSHGGYGASGTDGTDWWQAEPYGDMRDPYSFGGGGGGSPTERGGNGGGLARIGADTLVLDGRIAANGEASSGGSSYGGAGGAIWLSARVISGLGGLEANGGEPSGGGGRIAVYISESGELSPDQTSAHGGSAAGAGTVLYQVPGLPDGELRVDNAGNCGSGTPIHDQRLTRLLQTRGAQVSSWGEMFVNEVVLQGCSAIFENLVIEGSGEIRVEQDLDVYGAFSTPNASRIVLDGHNVYLPPLTGLDGVVLTLEHGCYFESWSWESLRVGGLEVLDGSILRFNTEPLSLEVLGELRIDSASGIYSDGGYPGGYNGQPGWTNGGQATSCAAGSHGGVGDAFGLTPVPTYDDFTNPREPGSGGCSLGQYGYGANGGGVVIIKADSLVLDGVLSVEGGQGSVSPQGLGGAGGSLNLEVGSLSGAGLLRANGGAPGGGGGRIAIAYADMSGFDVSQITAAGDAAGGAGTILLRSTSQVYGDMRIDNGGSSAFSASSPFAATGTDELWFDNLFVTNGAWMSTPDNLFVSDGGSLVVDGSSHLDSANLTLP
ncbi:MAG: hypothetical protein HY901_38075, partial [Deltaproteobacteria bacterium]|nr:hypothetical protein [Deltaproteobacteria bacterium]